MLFNISFCSTQKSSSYFDFSLRQYTMHTLLLMYLRRYSFPKREFSTNSVSTSHVALPCRQSRTALQSVWPYLIFPCSKHNIKQISMQLWALQTVLCCAVLPQVAVSCLWQALYMQFCIYSACQCRLGKTLVMKWGGGLVAKRPLQAVSEGEAQRASGVVTGAGEVGDPPFVAEGAILAGEVVLAGVAGGLGDGVRVGPGVMGVLVVGLLGSVGSLGRRRVPNPSTWSSR